MAFIQILESFGDDEKIINGSGNEGMSLRSGLAN